MTITIPANGKSTVPVNGKFFTCFSATANFKLTLDNDEERTCVGGSVIESPKRVRRATFRDTTGVPVDVEFEVGEEKLTVNPQVNSGGITIGAVTVSNAPGVLLGNSVAGCLAATPLQFVVPVPSPGTPVKLKAASTGFRYALIMGRKTLDGLDAAGDNVGNVCIGPSAAVHTQPIVITPGIPYELPIPPGAKWDFSEWYVDADNAGDAVVVLYT